MTDLHETMSLHNVRSVVKMGDAVTLVTDDESSHGDVLFEGPAVHRLDEESNGVANGSIHPSLSISGRTDRKQGGLVPLEDDDPPAARCAVLAPREAVEGEVDAATRVALNHPRA